MRMNPNQGIESEFALSSGRRERPRRMVMASAGIFENDCLGIAVGLVKRGYAPHKRRAIQKGGDAGEEGPLSGAGTAGLSGNMRGFPDHPTPKATGRFGGGTGHGA